MTFEAKGEQIATDLLRVSEVDFDASDPLTQALVGTFVFGMLHAHSMSEQRNPEDARSLAVRVFQNVLHYSPSAAVEGVQYCIEATRPGVHDTMNAILHRGIDGHRQYTDGDESGLRMNIKDILAYFRN